MSQNPYGSASEPEATSSADSQVAGSQQPAPQGNYGTPQYGANQQAAPAYPQSANGYNAYGVTESTESSPRPHVNLGGAFSRWAKNLFHFSGRASRSEFWWIYGAYVVFTGLVSSIIGGILVSNFAKSAAATEAYNKNPTIANYDKLRDFEDQVAGHVLILFVILSLLIFIATLLILSVWWRRLQDAGFPGALTLLTFISLGIVPFIMAFFPSKPEGYKYDKPVDYNRP